MSGSFQSKLSLMQKRKIKSIDEFNAFMQNQGIFTQVRSNEANFRISIGLAVVSQQFPQELGTLAILINSGLGIKRALLLNIVPMILSYAGFSVGVLLGTVNEGFDEYIYSISSGMYLYIFLGTLLPEIRDSINDVLKENLPEAILITVLQFSGIAFGLGFMFFMSIFGEDGSEAASLAQTR